MKKKTLGIIIVSVLGAAAIFCSAMFTHQYLDAKNSKAAFDDLTNLITEIDEPQKDAEAEESGLSVEELAAAEAALAHEKYAALFAQNNDFIGWIRIDGTNVNYPVMQTKNNPNFYLKHNFEKEYSDLGVPYIQEDCDLATSDNLIIYGHHIKGQKMFGALEDYKSESFYEKHKTIQFDTLTEQAEYEIIAVFKTVAYSAEGYRYYDFVDAENEEEFNAYVGKCKELALYDTGVTAEYGDRLITLSTCELMWYKKS